MLKPLAEIVPSGTNLLTSVRTWGSTDEQAKAAALLILGSYRSGDLADPRQFVANTISVLRRYAPDIVAEVCHPETGIQTRQKWLPMPSEVREACEQVFLAKLQRERRVLLNTHRVLVDTPRGLRPEAEAATEKPSQEARDRAVAHWEQIKASFEGEKRKKAQARRLEELSGQPLPKLSPAALKTCGIEGSPE
jgi:hypothetical protein